MTDTIKTINHQWGSKIETTSSIVVDEKGTVLDAT